MQTGEISPGICTFSTNKRTVQQLLDVHKQPIKGIYEEPLRLLR